jgi:cytochrome c oxidase assembly factor CtaG
MDPTVEAFLSSWPLDPWFLAALALAAGVYYRGWRRLRQKGSRHFDGGHLAAFLGGLAALFIALASPIEPFAALLLQVHMVQHMLLMMAAAPLLLLGAPALPLLRGLPEPVRRYWVAPLLRWPPLRACFRGLTTPPAAWGLFVACTWFWHAPPLYDVALRSNFWHAVEHGCFLGTALLFWWPVLQPYPSRPRWSRWAVVPYLFLADVQNTALSALLAFSNRILYPYYASVPRLGGISALDDQAAAGVIMWVPGSLAFLVPLVVIGSRLLYGGESGGRGQEAGGRRQGSEGRRQEAGGRTAGLSSAKRIALPLVASSLTPDSRLLTPEMTPDSRVLTPGFDLLRVPLLGRFLKWRHARLALQVPALLVAAAIILDGLVGPRLAPMNLAGVVPWIHWRGLVVLGLLVAGNLFCLACPFQLPRTLARRWLPGRWRWPRWLRAKWLAAGLLALFLWAYEDLSLWASPWWTAWIALGYFLAAFVIDSIFKGAAFCKYVCPIGQFHFVQSLVSPLEVRVRDPAACLHCDTRDCIRGNDRTPGCALHLFQPRKAGNMDCTFCLDCVHACPHDNLGLLASAPGSQLLNDPVRSGIGRFSRRPDLAALVLVLVFGAFANAAGMVAPVVAAEDRLAAALGLSSPGWIMTIGLIGAVVLAPLVLVGTAALLGRWWSGDPDRPVRVAVRFTYALVPLGAAMWLAHFLFHLVTSAGTLLPVIQRAAADVGVSFLGEPAWASSCCVPATAGLLRLEVLALQLGFLLSLYVGYRIARAHFAPLGRACRAFAPWAVLIFLLFAAGLWILFQPMEMRGTF